MTDASDTGGDDTAGADSPVGDDAPAENPARAAREQLLDAHTETLDAVLAAADVVAADWATLPDGRPATTERADLVDPFRSILDESGVLDALPELLAAAVDATGYTLPAVPVPAPPYVVVTSTGPVLRGTVEDGRLVVRIDCYEVTRESTLDSAVTYARAHSTVASALSVSFE